MCHRRGGSKFATADRKANFRRDSLLNGYNNDDFDEYLSHRLVIKCIMIPLYFILLQFTINK